MLQQRRIHLQHANHRPCDNASLIPVVGSTEDIGTHLASRYQLVAAQRRNQRAFAVFLANPEAFDHVIAKGCRNAIGKALAFAQLLDEAKLKLAFCAGVDRDLREAAITRA